MALRVAAVFSAMSLMAFLIGGDDVLRRKGVPSIERLIAIYFVGGGMTGCLAGVLAPLASSDFRAAFCGMLAIVPFGLMWRLMISGLGNWTLDDAAMQVLFSLILGGAFGIITRQSIVSGSDRSSAER